MIVKVYSGLEEFGVCTNVDYLSVSHKEYITSTQDISTSFLVKVQCIVFEHINVMNKDFIVDLAFSMELKTYDFSQNVHFYLTHRNTL